MLTNALHQENPLFHNFRQAVENQIFVLAGALLSADIFFQVCIDTAQQIHDFGRRTVDNRFAVKFNSLQNQPAIKTVADKHAFLRHKSAQFNPRNVNN